MKTIYKLTREGLKTTRKFLKECDEKRRVFVRAGIDTIETTELPTVEEITKDIENFIDEDGNYNVSWGVTDNYESDKKLFLSYGKDFLEV